MDLGKLGQRIKQQRERRQLRQADIASALRLTSQAVSKWERGENAPDIAVLLDLARLLGVSVEWILTGRQEAPGTFPAVVLCTSLNGFAERAARMAPGGPGRVVEHDPLRGHRGGPAVRRRAGEVRGRRVSRLLRGPRQGRPCAERRAGRPRSCSRCPDLVVVLHAGEIFLGSAGHPDYARTDIIGQTVNTAFLAMPFVAARCPGRDRRDAGRRRRAVGRAPRAPSAAG